MLRHVALVLLRGVLLRLLAGVPLAGRAWSVGRAGRWASVSSASKLGWPASVRLSPMVALGGGHGDQCADGARGASGGGHAAAARLETRCTYACVSAYGGMPPYFATAPGPALYAARASGTELYLSM